MTTRKNARLVISLSTAITSVGCDRHTAGVQPDMSSRDALMADGRWPAFDGNLDATDAPPQSCRTANDCASRVCTGGFCQPAQCGDNVVQDGEDCDDGNQNCIGVYPCGANCRWPEYVSAVRPASRADGNVRCETCENNEWYCNANFPLPPDLICPAGARPCSSGETHCRSCEQIETASADCGGRPSWGQDVWLVRYCSPVD